MIEMSMHSVKRKSIQILTPQERIQSLNDDAGNGIAVFFAVLFSTLNNPIGQLDRDLLGVADGLRRLVLILH